MRPELLGVINDVTDELVIEHFYERMSIKDLSQLFNLLEFVDIDTRTRWVTVYNNMFKRVH